MATPVERIQKILAEVGHVASLYGVKSEDQQFMRDVQSRQQRTLSAKQEEWLADIEKRVFEDDEE